MSVVFDYLERRLTEKGSGYWKTTPISAILVSKTDKDVDSSSLTISGTNLKEISGNNYSPYNVSGNTVYELNGKIIYSLDDLIWSNVTVSCDGVLLVNEDKPLIYVDFGFKRLAENGEFKVSWGDSGVLYLETSSVSSSQSSTSGSTTVIQSYGVESIENSSNGVGLFARIVNKVAYFKTLITDKWIKLSEENDQVKISINTDFLIEGKNVKLTKNEDGSVLIDVEISDGTTTSGSSSDIISTQTAIELQTVSASLDEHIKNNVIHITSAEREHWNSLSGISEVEWDEVKNTPTTISGYGITDVYTKTQVDNLVENFDEHIENNVIHITSFEREYWNSLSGISEVEWDKIKNTPTTVSGYGITDAYTKSETDSLLVPFENHIENSIIHVSQDERNYWNTVSGKVEKYVINVGTVGQDNFSVSNPVSSSDISYTVLDNITNQNVGIALNITSENISASDLRVFQQNDQLKIIVCK